MKPLNAIFSKGPSLILSYLLLLAGTQALAQVGLGELNQKVPNDYEGDPSVFIRSETTVEQAFRANGFRSFKGWSHEDQKVGPLDACTFQIEEQADAYNLVITDLAGLERKKDIRHELLIAKTDRIEETLVRGLESLTASYRSSRGAGSGPRDILFSITRFEGFIALTLDSVPGDVMCMTIESAVNDLKDKVLFDP
jgi:hypothetical protein